MAGLIIDTDPGVDDAFALALAALDPGVDLLGVTTVFGNVPLEYTTRNALRILELCGRPDVPVAAGSARPLVHRPLRESVRSHGSDGLSGRAETLPRPSREALGTGAVELIASLLEAATEPVTIAAIGPLTNIALLLAAYPRLTPKIGGIVVMGGAIDGGNIAARAEFNIHSDPEAAHRILVEEDVPCVLVPLDLTYRCAVDEQWLARLAASGRIGAALHGLTPDYLATYTKALGRPAMVLHDAVAVAEAITPGTLKTQTIPVAVECGHGPARGAVIADRRRPELIDHTGTATGRPIDVAVDIDIPAFHQHLLTTISH